MIADCIRVGGYMVRLLLAAILFSVAFVAASAACAERRVALVVGNKNYKHATVLNNTLNDARDVKGALEDVGFKVIPANDVDLAGLRAAIQQFARESRGADVSLFYYSGHGMQWDGENMLVPIDATFEDAEIMPFEVVPLREVMNALSLAGKAKIIILDACRDNDAEQALKIALAEKQGKRSTSIDRGLVKLDATRGQVVVFATQPDRTASDGFGGSSRNSPFTHAFLETIREPGLEIGRTFRKVAARVDKLTGGAQLPEISISLLGDFYFKPGERAVIAEPVKKPEPKPASSEDQIAEDYKLAERIGTEAAWGAFLAKHGDNAGNFYVLLATEARNKLAVGVFPDPDTPAEEKAEEPAVASEAPDDSSVSRSPNFAAIKTALSEIEFSGPTIADIRARGELSCGVNPGLQGFSMPNSSGHWIGFDVDFCKAVAAAILGDETKTRFTPLSAKERFTALQSGEIDLLSRNTTWTATRDMALGLNFAGISLYDGQGFMVRKDLGIRSALDLSGAAVCVNTGTTTELNVANYFRANDMSYDTVSFDTQDDVRSAYDVGRCDVLTTDATYLHAIRLNLTNPDDHLVLPEIISKEPLGPVVREGDRKFEQAVRFVLDALVRAEELGVSSANIDEQGDSQEAEVQLLLSPSWVTPIIRQVGNYAEIFERNIGPNTPLGMERGLNALWNEGGLMTAAVLNEEYLPPKYTSATAKKVTLAGIKKRGKLRCLGNNTLDNFLCEAISIAIFGKLTAEPKDSVVMSDVAPKDPQFWGEPTASELIPKLQSGKLDIIVGSPISTWLRSHRAGLEFPAASYRSGPGIMVRKSLGVSSVDQLSGKTVCFADGTRSAMGVATYFRLRRIEFNASSFASLSDAIAAYEREACDALSANHSYLAVDSVVKNHDEHTVLPQLLEIQSTGPALFTDDDALLDIVRWVVFTIISAEEIGIALRNFEQAKQSNLPAVRRLLGRESNFGADVGLEAGWASEVVSRIGNYAEIHRSSGPYNFKRGVNALWNKGGLLYSPPIR